MQEPFHVVRIGRTERRHHHRAEKRFHVEWRGHAQHAQGFGIGAQINFANAQSSEIGALADYQISQVDLAYATGTILGADKVQWAPAVPDSDKDE